MYAQFYNRMPNWSDMLTNIGKTAVNQTMMFEGKCNREKPYWRCLSASHQWLNLEECVWGQRDSFHSQLLKRKGAFLCLCDWTPRDTRLHKLPCSISSMAVTGCQNSCSPLFPESLRDRLTKGGMRPWHPHRLCPEEGRTPPPFPWLLQPDFLPASRGTAHTHHSSPHQHTAAICVPQNATRCSPLPPKRSQFQQAPLAVWNKLILHNHHPIATLGDVMCLSVTKGWEVQTLGHAMGLLKCF